MGRDARGADVVAAQGPCGPPNTKKKQVDRVSACVLIDQKKQVDRVLTRAPIDPKKKTLKTISTNSLSWPVYPSSIVTTAGGEEMRCSAGGQSEISLQAMRVLASHAPARFCPTHAPIPPSRPKVPSYAFPAFHRNFGRRICSHS